MTAQPVDSAVDMSIYRDRDPSPDEWRRMGWWSQARWRSWTGRESPFPAPTRRLAPTVAELRATPAREVPALVEPAESPWDELFSDPVFWRAMLAQVDAYAPHAPRGWRRSLGMLGAGVAELMDWVECGFTDEEMAEAARVESAYRKGRGPALTAGQVAARRAYKRISEASRRRRVALKLDGGPATSLAGDSPER